MSGRDAKVLFTIFLGTYTYIGLLIFGSVLLFNGPPEPVFAIPAILSIVGGVVYVMFSVWRRP